MKEDFKRFHGLDVNELDGAIMSDTDNSKKGSSLLSEYLFFSRVI